MVLVHSFLGGQRTAELEALWYPSGLRAEFGHLLHWRLDYDFYERVQCALLRQVTRESMSTKPMFRVIFQNQGEVFEVYARQIFQSELWGFIEVEEFVFGERSQLLVDPSEEKLKNTFEGVKRSYVPLTAIVRIDEVEKEGAAKVVELKEGNIKPFPVPPSPHKL